MRKFRITETATGRFKLEVLASDPGDEEHWVMASKDEFQSRNDAETGIERIVAKRCWYYDEKGKICR